MLVTLTPEKNSDIVYRIYIIFTLKFTIDHVHNICRRIIHIILNTCASNFIRQVRRYNNCVILSCDFDGKEYFIKHNIIINTTFVLG